MVIQPSLQKQATAAMTATKTEQWQDAEVAPRICLQLHSPPKLPKISFLPSHQSLLLLFECSQASHPMHIPGKSAALQFLVKFS